MAINEIGRLTIFSDTEANVEAATGALAEIRFARRTTDDALGFYIGGTWYWLEALPPSGAAGGDLTGTYPDPSVVWANGEATLKAYFDTIYAALGSVGSGVHEVVMETGQVSPTPIINSAGDDWVYSS